jgi:hypothetical protein
LDFIIDLLPSPIPDTFYLFFSFYYFFPAINSYFSFSFSSAIHPATESAIRFISPSGSGYDGWDNIEIPQDGRREEKSTDRVSLVLYEGDGILGDND